MGKYDNKNIYASTYHLLLIEEAASYEPQQTQRRLTVSLKASQNGGQPSSLAAAQREMMRATCVPFTDTGAPLQAAPHAQQKLSGSPSEPGPQSAGFRG